MSEGTVKFYTLGDEYTILPSQQIEISGLRMMNMSDEPLVVTVDQAPHPKELADEIADELENPSYVDFQNQGRFDVAETIREFQRIHNHLKSAAQLFRQAKIERRDEN